MAGIDGYDWSGFGGNPAPGDPDGIRVIASRLRDLSAAVAMQNRLLRSVGGDSEAVWVGPAADAFRPHLEKLPAQMEQLVTSYGDAADALDSYWPVLTAAQHTAVEAWHKARMAQAQVDTARTAVSTADAQARAAAEAYNQAATAAMSAPPDPSGATTAHVQGLQASYQSASTQAATARSALQAAESSLQAAHTLAEAARTQARTAARRAASGLHSASNAGIHDPHHSWLSSVVDDVKGAVSSAAHQVEQFGSGLWNGVAGPLTMLAKLADPLTAPEELRQLATSVAYAVDHPAAFGKALLDWNDLSSGNIARWLGNLTPAVAAAFFTGGAGDVVRGADGITALEKAGVSADDIAALAASDNQEAAARIIMRGDDPVPGAIYADQPPLLGRDMSTPDDPETWFGYQSQNFIGSVRKSESSDERMLANLHDSQVPLRGDPGGVRSLFWGSRPTDLLAAGSERNAMDVYALPPDWGARDEVTIIHVPAGSGPTWEGAAAPQIGEKSKIYVPGSGHQVLLHTVASDDAVWTGPAPWVRTADPGLVVTGAGKTIAGAGAWRLADGLASQP